MKKLIKHHEKILKDMWKLSWIFIEIHKNIKKIDQKSRNYVEKWVEFWPQNVENYRKLCKNLIEIGVKRRKVIKNQLQKKCWNWMKIDLIYTRKNR